MVSRKIILVMMALISASAYSEEVVKIGLMGPLTGPSATIGKENENGTKLAIADLNAKSMKINEQSIRFVIDSQDDQGDPRTGTQVAQRLIDDGVVAVLGPAFSGVAIPASKIFETAQIPMITGNASNPTLTEQGYSQIYRISANDNQLAARVANFAAKNLKLKSVAIIDDRTAYGEGVADAFAKALESSGVTVVGREYTSTGATDFRAILTKLKEQSPEAIFFGGMYSQGAYLYKQMRSLGLNRPLLGGDGLCADELLQLIGGRNDSQVYCARTGVPLETSKDGTIFKNRYQKEFGSSIALNAQNYYAALNVLAQAMIDAKSTDPKKFSTKLKNSSFSTVVGTIRFDKNGDWISAPSTIYKSNGDKYLPVLDREIAK